MDVAVAMIEDQVEAVNLSVDTERGTLGNTPRNLRPGCDHHGIGGVGVVEGGRQNGRRLPGVIAGNVSALFFGFVDDSDGIGGGG